MGKKKKVYSADFYPKILDDVKTNKDLIYVFDDVLDHREIEQINNFDWFSNNWDNGYNCWPLPCPELPFAHMLCSRMIQYLESIDKDVKLIEHIGSYFVLRHHTRENLTDNIHRDFYDKKYVWTGIFHLIGKSGPTVFYPDFESLEPIKEIDFKPGRLIIFPSLYAHHAGIFDVSEMRLVHSVRLLIDSKLNEKYF